MTSIRSRDLWPRRQITSPSDETLPFEACGNLGPVVGSEQAIAVGANRRPGVGDRSQLTRNPTCARLVT